MAEFQLSTRQKVLLSCCFTLILAACGGGGGTSDPGFIGGGADHDHDTPTITMVLEITDSDGNPTTTVTTSSPATLTVTASNGNQPAAGEIVLVTAPDVALTPASGSQLSDADGIAQFEMATSGFSGGTTAVATIGEFEASINFEVVSVLDASLELALTDADGNATTNVTSVSPGTLTVTARDSLGQPLANAILTATTTIGEIQPATGTALTDLNGMGTFRIAAGETLGAGSVIVTVGTSLQSLNFQVGEANLRIGSMVGATFVEGVIEPGATSLPAGGSTTLAVVVVDEDEVPVPTTVAVFFSSGCASLEPPTAEITALVSTVSGVATSTYTADGCTGTDIITAGIVQGNSQTATVSLDIASADVNSISFISADPTTMALKGTGGEGRQETSTVEFQVLDATGAPVQGYDVAFSLSTEIGGLSLTNDSATTNGEGIARAIVLSGNVSTSVRVTATIVVDGLELTTVSDRLVVSTGLPDQNSISLSVDRFNVGGGDDDGTEATVTVRMADKFNNPVPDGTSAFFTTEYGTIEDSCETAGGVCSVTWTSQQPRLPLIYNNVGTDEYVSTLSNRVCTNTGASGTPCATDGTLEGSAAVGITSTYGRRSTVLVTAIGEESFVDSNGNGLYDAGEDHQDLAEAFVDNNENRPEGSWLTGYDGDSFCVPSDTDQAGRDCASGLEETFVDFDDSGSHTDGNGIYNGTLCPESLNGISCSQDLVSVRQDLVILMSATRGQQIAVVQNNGGGGADVVITSVPDSNNTVSYQVLIGDEFNNLPPAGATISVSSTACELASSASFTVPSTTDTGPYQFGLTLTRVAGNAEIVQGFVTIALANPTGDSPPAYILICNDPIGP